MIVWGGTTAMVFLHTVESIRKRTVMPLTVVVPVATLVGTWLASPGASTSWAAREQFPLGIVHQLDVMG
ncbi:MAG: hypothetical protein AUH81_08045 [Candidatus Rokubacteria bacterium 13_1_40CM_4_69_5]|nr:MAG: hypothetical protein AUH81_08045 [Candidatus Rokubacteria bacterium 13_1_40CM_4_69_5]